MKTYQVEILEPGAKKILEELANMNLITVQEVEPLETRFKNVLKKLRTNGPAKRPSLGEITKEVDAVRKKRLSWQKTKRA